MGYTLSHIQKVGYHVKHSNEYVIINIIEDSDDITSNIVDMHPVP